MTTFQERTFSFEEGGVSRWKEDEEEQGGDKEGEELTLDEDQQMQV
jgi:hypothetical protein